MATIESLLSDRVSLQVRSVDRIFLAGYVPKLLAILLIIASATYLVDSVGKLLIPSYASNEMLISILMVPSTLGETIFLLWVLIWGRRLPTPESVAQT